MQRSKIDRFALADISIRSSLKARLGSEARSSRVQASAELLDVAPDETWMVGDNLEWDVAEPQRQGIYGIWIDVRGTGLRRAPCAAGSNHSEALRIA